MHPIQLVSKFRLQPKYQKVMGFQRSVFSNDVLGNQQLYGGGVDDLAYPAGEMEELFYVRMVGVAVCLVGVALWEYSQSLFPRSSSKKQPIKVHTYAVGMLYVQNQQVYFRRPSHANAFMYTHKK